MQTITKSKGLLAKLKLLAILFAFLLINGQSWGQTAFTATYTFTGTTGNVASFTYNGTTYTGISMGTIQKVGVTTSSSSGNFRATGWPTATTPDVGKYIGFTVTAQTGYKFTITSINFGLGRSATGTRTSQWRGSADSYGALINNYTTLNASLTNTAGEIGNPDATTAYTGNDLTLGSSYADITTSIGFRYYMYASEATAGTAGLQGAITISGTFELTGGGIPPTLVADILDNNVDNNVDITFTNDATWLAAVSAVKVGSTTLTPLIDYELTAGNLKLKPSGLNPILTTSGAKNVVIEAAGYSITSVSQVINAGLETKLGVKTQPTAPISNGNVLATQPAIYIQDQYGNTTTSNASVTASVASGTWTMGGNTLINASAGTATFSGLTATSISEVVDASIIFSSGSLVSVTSSMFAIPAPGPDLTVSSTSLTGFNYFVGSGPSAEQSFTVSAINLISDISITAPSHYEVSLVSGSGFASTVTLTPVVGSVGTTTIYLRLKSGLLQGNFNNEIVNITSQNAASKTLTLSGTVSCSTSFPLFENFNYSLSSILTNNCWTAHSTGINPITVSANSISYPGYLSSGIGNEISLNTSGEDVNKTITAQTTGTIYTSFLVNVSSATLTGDYFFHLGQTIIGTTFKGKIFVKKDASSSLAFGIANSLNTPIYSAFDYALNTTYLIVLKFDIINGASNDASAIYINPTLNAPLSNIGWINATDAIGTDFTEVGSIAFRQGNSSSAPALKISGIRVSNNWEDIVGTLLSEPTNHASTFTATSASATAITNTWNDNDGVQAATSYLILANTTGNFTDPVDGVFEADDIDLSDGLGRINVNHGVQTYEWTGLTSGTQYYFKIYPYNGTGAAINYKTDGIVPESNATTLTLNKTLNLTLLLEGLFNEVNMNMDPVIGSDVDIEGNPIPMFGANIADQITVELRESTMPFNEAYTLTNLNLLTNGNCVIDIPAEYADNYYIVIRHRNSIETWSNSAVSFAGTTINYDFTTSQNAAYGGNLKSMNGGVFVIYGGDSDGSGFIDGDDFNAIDNSLYTSGYLNADVDGNGFIDGDDFNIVDNNLYFGVNSPILP